MEFLNKIVNFLPQVKLYLELVNPYLPALSCILLLFISFQISRRTKELKGTRGKIMAHKFVTKKARKIKESVND